jgi:hypothetical protein
MWCKNCAVLRNRFSALQTDLLHLAGQLTVLQFSLQLPFATCGVRESAANVELIYQIIAPDLPDYRADKQKRCQ